MYLAVVLAHPRSANRLADDATDRVLGAGCEYCLCFVISRICLQRDCPDASLTHPSTSDRSVPGSLRHR
ncbi:hypothetical protein FA95DRAFT_1554356 [Auriscalpium vulgare]|uniref:Uncharacterized protein n=1 Tax=Auriscalpium vulgare TaxID=40419 RepID=A0ACB8S5M1_9AGAM|nr:hypothetical protein FA95DRAFT_1554356 [Auriscalpium vulgare]